MAEAIIEVGEMRDSITPDKAYAFWRKRSRLEKLALAAGALTVGAGVAVVIAPEIAAAAAGSAVTAAAAWVMKKGLHG